MSQASYTVTVEPRVGDAIQSQTVSAQVAAINIAKKWAKEYVGTEYGVYIEFFYPSEGNHGYINPDGSADVAGTDWTKAVMPELVGVAESAEILGWDRRKVSTYIKRGVFPEPVQRLRSGPLWTRKQIDEYRDRNNK